MFKLNRHFPHLRLSGKENYLILINYIPRHTSFVCMHDEVKQVRVVCVKVKLQDMNGISAFFSNIFCMEKGT